ncbi:MAG: putative porin [Melioribacteraceae bacterium]|nr:putative porin [Melioribacteraceae bacterium]
MIKPIILILFFFLISIEISALNLFAQDSISINDSLKTDTTAAAIDSLDIPIPRDTLKPIEIKGFIQDKPEKADFNRTQIRRTDHRFTGDLFNHMNFGYLADFGTVGTPSEVYLFGFGFSDISYLQNGVPTNNRFHNSLDLNLIQAASLDSIELASLSTGFFYSSINNPVSVNFNTRLKVDPRPYSRISFYQGPENEGIVDGMFSAYPFNKVNVSFQVTNQSTDARFDNSEVSNWLFNTRVRYLLNNNINFIIGYDHARLNVDLNGGVNVRETPALLYDNILAAVNYEDRYHRDTRHNLFAKTIIKIDSLSYSDVSIYYQDQLNEFRQNELSIDSLTHKIINDNAYKTYGASVDQRIIFDKFNLQFLARYEKTKFEIERDDFFRDMNFWSVGSKLEINLFDKFLTPSFFIKLSDYDGTGLFGFGGNVSLNVNKYFSLFAGFSKFERPSNIINTTTDVTVIEAAIVNRTQFGKLSLSYFNLKQDDYIFAAADTINVAYASSTINNNIIGEFARSGLNFKVDFRLWKIKLLSNNSYYFDESALADPTIPRFTSFGGLYYVDTLFNQNLDLKTGINYKFYSERKFAAYDFETFNRAFHDINGNNLIGVNEASNTNIAYQFDFFLAGTIQERATIYIAFENLFDAQYYLIPYYPVQPRGLRIGFTWEFLD